MSVYFQQLPDFINAKILYQFKGLQHPTALLIKNIITEIDACEFADIDVYLNEIEKGWAQQGHLIDNKLDFLYTFFNYKGVLRDGGEECHITYTWAEHLLYEERCDLRLELQNN